jgi:CrcB protein
MKLMLLASAGGAIGAGGRYLVNVGMGRWLGAGFPWSTLSVNVVGSLLMGIVIEAFALRFQGSMEARTFLTTGVLGGFTTFSAFSLDFVTLIERKQQLTAGMYLAGSVGVSIFALFAGMALMRAVLA